MSDITPRTTAGRLRRATRARPQPVTPDPTAGAIDQQLARLAHGALVLTGIVVAVVALRLGQPVLAPVLLAITVGLMFEPVADRLERTGLGAPWAAALVVLLFLAVWAAATLLLAGPVAVWIEKLPFIWARFQQELTDWKSLIASVGDLRRQLQALTGAEGALTVVVEEENALTQVALLAPSILAQVVVFLVSLYFFLATRREIRLGILQFCPTFRIRLRVARMVRDAQIHVGRYLLTISAINAALGALVALAMFALDVPSPLLLGMLAFLLNYVMFVGPVAMIGILLVVGFASAMSLGPMLLPALVYLAFHGIESQIVTPHLVGRAMTVNPFAVFVVIVFWLWLWGPAGGFIAVPCLLLLNVVMLRSIPSLGARHL